MSSTDTKPTPKPGARLQLRWLTPNDSHERSRVSKVHEKRIAKELGGRRLPNSGARRHSKWRPTSARGDVTTPEFHVEHKRTEHASMSVKYAWLEKIVEEAHRQGLDPALVITFQIAGTHYDRPASERVPVDWMLVPVAVMKRMIAAIRGE